MIYFKIHSMREFLIFKTIVLQYNNGVGACILHS